MTMPRVLLLTSLLGCADYNAAGEAMGTTFDPADTAEMSGDVPLSAVRVQVRPSGEASVLPQSFLLNDRSQWATADLELQPTIALHGRITGYEAAPTAVAVPGEEDAPVVARVQAAIPGDPNLRSTNSDEDGDYALFLPTGSDYVLSVVPISPATLPLAVETGLTFSRDELRDLPLGFGLPVTGRLLQSDGTPLVTARPPVAYLVEAETGLVGPAARVDTDGYFALRAEPGAYTLVIEGAQGTAVPRLEIADIAVTDELDEAAPIAVDAGQINPADVSGRVVNADGGPVSQATIRFTSRLLDEARGSLTVETATDQNGIFSRQLLPGRWAMEIIPAYEVDGESSPLAMEIEVPTLGADLEEVALADRIDLRGAVVGPTGDPLKGVVVAVEEAGFNHYVYTTSTDADGQFRCSVPQTAVTVRIQPPNDQDAAITPFPVPDPKAAQSTYSLGRGTLIAGTASAPDGALSYAVVEVRTPDGDLLGTTLTDANGRYSLRIAD